MKTSILVVDDMPDNLRLLMKILNQRGYEVRVAHSGALALQSVQSLIPKGAFTGALRNQPGFFDAAHKGTLFLDEVGELSLIMQAKLLRAIEGKGHAVILIADDNLGNVTLLCELLSEQGHHVRVAMNGALALSSAQEEVPDRHAQQASANTNSDQGNQPYQSNQRSISGMAQSTKKERLCHGSDDVKQVCCFGNESSKFPRVNKQVFQQEYAYENMPHLFVRDHRSSPLTACLGWQCGAF